MTTSGNEPVVLPLAREELRVERRVVEKGKVVLRKTVREREEVVDQPAYAERVEVERVPVGRWLDGPVGVRQEGDTTVIPILEEVLVVEKRLRLREEVRVTRRREERHEPQRVTLRSEDVAVERVENSPAAR